MNALISQSTVPFRHPSNGPSRPLLRISQVASLYSLHPNTLRNATARGALPCRVLDSGHRRYEIEEVERWLGRGNQNEQENGAGEGKTSSSAPARIAKVTRVSTYAQNQKQGNAETSSLQNQSLRCDEFISERFGGNVQVTEYSRVASGLNFQNETFLTLIKDILDKKFDFLVASSFDRVARFATDLITHLCKISGCEVLYVLNEDDQSEENSLTQDILALLCSFTAKQSGLKCRKLFKVNLDEGSLKEAFLLVKAGNSYRKIEKLFEGRTDEKGRKYSHSIIYKCVTAAWDELNAAFPKTEATSLDAFLDDREVIGKKKNGTVSVKDFKAAYLEWCKDNEFQPVISRHKFATIILARGLACKYQWRINGREICGVYLKG